MSKAVTRPPLDVQGFVSGQVSSRETISHLEKMFSHIELCCLIWQLAPFRYFKHRHGNLNFKYSLLFCCAVRIASTGIFGQCEEMKEKLNLLHLLLLVFLNHFPNHFPHFPVSIVLLPLYKYPFTPVFLHSKRKRLNGWCDYFWAKRGLGLWMWTLSKTFDHVYPQHLTHAFK